MGNPLVSFIIPARNDQYAGNSNYRLNVTLDFLAENLHRLNRLNDAEIVVVDWGSDVPLSGALALSKYARQITRFIVVPPSVAKEVSPEHGFPISIVLNTGVRRASGTFIAQAIADFLFPQKILARLFDICDFKVKLKKPVEETLFVCNRKRVPQEVVDRQPSIAELGEFIEKIDKVLPVEYHTFTLVPADCQLMHRKLWQECQGYDERYIYWGWIDVDLVIRMRLKYPALNDPDGSILYVYHLDHYVPPHHARNENRPFFNPLTVNDENWGLADYQFKEIPSAMESHLLPAAPPAVRQKNFVVTRKHYVLLALKFAATNLRWKNIKGAKSFLKAMISGGPQESIWYKIYFYGRRLRKSNRNRSS